jgi:hypothetical protein
MVSKAFPITIHLDNTFHTMSVELPCGKDHYKYLMYIPDIKSHDLTFIRPKVVMKDIPNQKREEFIVIEHPKRMRWFKSNKLQEIT